jgi:membrane-bound serine protease (ClpP class)
MLPPTRAQGDDALMNVRRLLIASLLALASWTGAARAGDGSYVLVHLDGEVDLGMAPLVQRAVREAHEQGAKGLVLDIDTFGGRLDAAVLIRDALLEADVPTTCYVDRRAISAGALICMATDTIDMAPGSTIGAATPIREDGGEIPESVNAKVTSYVRKEFGATAEARHRRRDLAEAMVDREVVVEGASNRPLTLTTAEALSFGLAARSSDSLDAAVAASGLGDSRRVPVEMNWAEKAARIITMPVISGLLLSIGMLGLVIEVKAPGWGPGIIGVTALFVFLFGHQVVRLAGWEDVLLVAIGLVLLGVEIFLLPGFGIAGVLGLLFFAGGVVLAMVGRDWDAAVAAGALRTALVTSSSAVLVSAAAFAALVRVLPHSRLARAGLMLETTLANADSFGAPLESLVGREGLARTMLRPSGSVVLDGLGGADGTRFDAVSEGEVIPAGSRVRVVAMRGGSLVVRLVVTEAP